jgi:hypothetical protein
MAVLQTAAESTMEAVIISGSRKGEFITLGSSEDEWSPEAEVLLDSLVAGAKRMAASAQAAADETDALLAELRKARIQPV